MTFITFQDTLGIGTLIATVAWMLIAFVLFKLQAQTFKSQLDMQKLDYERFLLQIRPSIIKAKSPHSKFSTEEYKGFQGVFVGILVTKNSLKELCIFTQDNQLNQYKNLNKSLSRWYLQNGQVDDPIRIIQGNLSYKDVHLPIHIGMIYKDELDNSYLQELSGRITRLTISSPKKISPDEFHFLFNNKFLPDVKANPMVKPKLLRKNPKDPYS